jgi:hypothetical protein
MRIGLPIRRGLRTNDHSGDRFMALKAPGILTFMLSVILAVAVLIVKFFGASIPFVNGNEFWFLLIAHIILVLGCIMRGL